MAFYNESNDHTNFVASFTGNPKDDFGVFAKGYTLAADRLSNLLLGGPPFSDYEAYPIVFLYRHALELSLKHVIYTSAKLSAFKFLDDIGGELRNTHDLTKLSQTVGALLSILFPEDNGLRDIIALVKKTCSEFSDIDPISDGYRYPINSKGQPSTKHHQVINLRTFANRMSSVLEDLDTIHFGLDIETDKAQEVYEIIQDSLCSISSLDGL
jgi:hypothetical protein